MLDWIFGSKYKSLNNDELREALKQDKNAVLIDVRTAGEFKTGKINGARNIDVSNGFIGNIRNLDKGKNYYVYCQSGMRSRMACRMMANQGFENVYNLKGGILSWKGDIK